jgi:hypothetical protein
MNSNYYLGGKPDDITVIVSLIVKNSNCDMIYSSTNTSITDFKDEDEYK